MGWRFNIFNRERHATTQCVPPEEMDSLATEIRSWHAAQNQMAPSAAAIAAYSNAANQFGFRPRAMLLADIGMSGDALRPMLAADLGLTESGAFSSPAEG